MTVRIVTDSTVDISLEQAAQMGVTIVPVYVRFGDEVLRDLYDINNAEFYRRLETSGIHPTSSQPAPGDFAKVYQELSKDTDEILSIHLTSKLSGTYNAALQGREVAESQARIEIIDTFSLSMAVGMAVMSAAKLAAAGESLDNIIQDVREKIAATRIFGIFDTIRHLQRGGRVGQAVLRLGSLLNIKPLLEVRDGVLAPVGAVRVREHGITKLKQFLQRAVNPVELAVVYNTFADEANAFRDYVAEATGCPVHLAQLGPALGVHSGPGTLLLAVRDSLAEPAGR
jgi:DegV family protein with EDD domain